MLRYSNNSVLDNFSPNVNVENVQNVRDSDLTRFNDILAATLNVVKQEATNSLSSGKKFATKEANFMNLMKLYTLAQCTPDLSNLDCDMCFSMAISYLGDGKRGAQGLFHGCILRYELYPFYNVSAVSIHPDLAPSSSGSSSISKIVVFVVSIVVPIVVVVVLFIVGVCFPCKRASKKYNTFVQDSIVDDLPDVKSLQFDLATVEAATNGFQMRTRSAKVDLVWFIRVSSLTDRR